MPTQMGEGEAGSHSLATYSRDHESAFCWEGVLESESDGRKLYYERGGESSPVAAPSPTPKAERDLLPT